MRVRGVSVLKPCRISRDATSPLLKAALWLGVVYLLGIAIGAMAAKQFYVRVHASESAPLTPQERRAHVVEDLAREVNLTDVQRQSLDRILDDMSVQFEAIHRQTDAKISQLRMQGRGEIRAILTPDQRPKYDEWLRRLDEERNHNSGQAEHK
jgi:Spy/CpxP family protein refolding chaperone